MPDGFDFKFGDQLSERQLAYLSRFLLDLRTLWPIVTTRFIAWMSEEFETEGESWVGPWAPLSESYRQWKETQRPGKGILSFDGDLRRAATTPRRVVTPLSLTLAIDGFTHRGSGEQIDPAWFQDGTDTMPARPLIGTVLTPAMQLELREATEEYVRGILETIR